jgi:hypothetical protein
MHKKLEADLVSLAHSILQMKNRNDILALKEKSREIYEKLAILAFVDEFTSNNPNTDISKEKVIEKIENSLKSMAGMADPSSEKKTTELLKDDDSTDIFEPKFDDVKIDVGILKSNQISLKEEFKDSISADKTATLFDDDSKQNQDKKSLNDKLVNDTIQVGLNDRIAFVNHLFNFNQQDFNRVLSQLNTFKTELDAKKFIDDIVKPDYDWTGKEAYEERLINLIERKFS